MAKPKTKLMMVITGLGENVTIVLFVSENVDNLGQSLSAFVVLYHKLLYVST